jgi:hypothetical protein
VHSSDLFAGFPSSRTEVYEPIVECAIPDTRRTALDGSILLLAAPEPVSLSPFGVVHGRLLARRRRIAL